MDPKACLERLLGALRDDDIGEARDAAADLERWFSTGGFPSRWPQRAGDTGAATPTFDDLLESLYGREIFEFERSCEREGPF